MQVCRWGNSLAVRLPAALVKALELKEGDDIDITLVGDRHLKIQKKPSRNELVERLKLHAWDLPEGFKFDREEANAR